MKGNINMHMHMPMPMYILGAGVVIIGIMFLYRRYYKNITEGMVNGNPEMEDLKKQAETVQTIYDQIKTVIDDQTNRIQANAQMLLTIVSDTPNQTNSVTHANVNPDDPSKTRIPKIS